MYDAHPACGVAAKETESMPSTFCNIILHIIFSTKHRHPWIADDLKGRLYRYIGGIVRGEGGKLLEIGGMEDHVHLLLSWRTDESVAELLRNLKSHSSLWIHQTFPHLRIFAWQEGYAVFSVSHSQASKVRAYIQKQLQHHRQRSFQEEFEEFLTAHGIEYDRRFARD
jgi:putative transposase